MAEEVAIGADTVVTLAVSAGTTWVGCWVGSGWVKKLTGVAVGDGGVGVAAPQAVKPVENNRMKPSKIWEIFIILFLKAKGPTRLR
ncbi:MAG: hypothetical protein BroJett011_38380 [Chloroflexota bacterium]|nr:MAG: hypothetical protein BroJett011_38380 [Chloroflexota bacterium]